jgi:hypothetical protein
VLIAEHDPIARTFLAENVARHIFRRYCSFRGWGEGPGAVASLSGYASSAALVGVVVRAMVALVCSALWRRLTRRLAALVWR